tara:strand:+ start:477 stop:926 length:450 start_codon:yes stop_codon:yes gene_type:complete
MNKKHIFFISLVVFFSFEINAAKYDKEDPSELYEKATNQLQKENYRAALKTLKKYTKAEKKDADGWTLLAFTNRKLKNYAKAENLYEKALKLDPNNKIALEYQGELYIELERLDEANANLAKLVELCPNSCEELEMLRDYIDGNQTKAW